jgi:Na+/phosphate symporter
LTNIYRSVALVAIGVVILAGVVTVLALNPTALSLELVDTIARTTVTTFLLAWAGVGIGALTRSTAAATFVVIALYWLIPIALMIAGLTGASWATSASDASLGILAANAITPGPEHWGAAGGIALWATTLTTLGILRETNGK